MKGAAAPHVSSSLWINRECNPVGPQSWPFFFFFLARNKPQGTSLHRVALILLPHLFLPTSVSLKLVRANSIPVLI